MKVNARESCPDSVSSVRFLRLKTGCVSITYPQKRGVAQPGSAPEWGSGGRRFESVHPDSGQPKTQVLLGHNHQADQRTTTNDNGRNFRQRGMKVCVKYKVVLEPQDEGGYTVYVPALPGCVSQGETSDEAMANIKEAIEVYRESLKARGISLPRVEEREVAV